MFKRSSFHELAVYYAMPRFLRVVVFIISTGTAFYQNYRLISFYNVSMARGKSLRLKILNWIFTDTATHNWNSRSLSLSATLSRSSMDVTDKKCNSKDDDSQVPVLWFSQMSAAAINAQLEIKGGFIIDYENKGWRDAEESFAFISFLLTRLLASQFSILLYWRFVIVFFNILHACKNNWKSSSVKLFLVLQKSHFSLVQCFLRQMDRFLRRFLFCKFHWMFADRFI